MGMAFQPSTAMESSRHTSPRKKNTEPVLVFQYPKNLSSTMAERSGCEVAPASIKMEPSSRSAFQADPRGLETLADVGANRPVVCKYIYKDAGINRRLRPV